MNCPQIAPVVALALVFLGSAGCQSTPPAPAVAETQSVKPGINDEFLKPDLNPRNWVERFEKEGREVFDHRREIVAAAQLKPGARIADVGAGTGLFTFLFADAVGAQGKVYAVDISTPLLAHLKGRAAEGGYRQVVTVLGADKAARLAPNSVDTVFLCDTYHHFEFPQHMLASLHEALTRDGELLLVEFKRIPGVSSDWMLSHVRAGQEVFEAEIAAAGFRKVGEPVVLKDNYVSRFRKARR
jgi:predicted methyltransferase